MQFWKTNPTSNGTVMYRDPRRTCEMSNVGLAVLQITEKVPKCHLYVQKGRKTQRKKEKLWGV